MSVQRSGFSVFPDEITKVFSAMRLSGCCFCFRRKILEEIVFDIKVKRWGFMEDQDLTYRIYKKHPQSLYVLPSPKIYHKISKVARLPNKTGIQMKTIYRFYFFFKNSFDGSALNLLAFSWAIMGNLILTTLSLVIKRKNKKEWWTLIDLLRSYTLAFGNLRNLISGKLDFFNNILSRNLEENH